jgi:hypothetical protein
MGAFRLGEAAGLGVTRYLQSGSIDYGKTLKTLYSDVKASVLEAYRKKSAERVRITPVTDGAASPDEPAPVAAPQAEAASFFF